MVVSYNYSTEDIKAYFSYSDFSRGSNYYRQKRVIDLEIDEDKLSAKVQGTKSNPYSVEILITKKNNKPSFFATCTCPVGFGCKHMVAVLLAAMAPAVENSSESIPASQEVKLNYALSNWLDSLTATQEENNTGKLVVYIIEGPSNNNVAFKVSPVIISILKKGMFSSSTRPCRLDQITDYNRAQYIHDNDLVILRLIASFFQYHRSYTSFEIPATIEATMLLQLIMATKRCYLPSLYLPENMLVMGSPRLASISWKTENNGAQNIQVAVDGLNNPVILNMYPPHYICTSSRIVGVLETGLPDQQAIALLKAPSIPPEQAALFSEKLLPILSKSAPIAAELLPKALPICKYDVKPVPHLKLTSAIIEPKKMKNAWTHYYEDPVEIAVAALSFDYDGKKLTTKDAATEISSYKKGEVLVISRDKKFEQGCIEFLQHIGLKLPLENVSNYYKIKQGYESALTMGEKKEDFHKDKNLIAAWGNFTKEAIPHLKEMGWQVKMEKSFPYNIVEADDEWYANIEEGSGIDWFGVELGVNVEGTRFNLLPILLDFLKKKEDFSKIESLIIPMKDGRKLSIPPERAKILLNTLQHLFSFHDVIGKDGKLKMNNLDSALLAEIEASAESLNMRWFGGEKIRKLGKRLKEFTEISSTDAAKIFKGELRHYQQDGLNWLQFLREYELAGILADDMGLGKTVQVLAHIAKEKEENRLTSPFLVIAPTSLMVNWRMEAERFIPDLKVLTLHGSNRKMHFNDISKYDLILTTYPLLVRDKDILLNSQYHTIILDEAQTIKNSRAKVTQIANQLKSKHRLCLTGTPLENHLGELWSLFNFLLPGHLGSQQQFGSLFRNPIEKNGDVARGQTLARRIKPFILRRTKQQVATELPPKTEMIRMVELEGTQRDLYETIRISMNEKIRKEIAARGMDKSHIIILDALLKLRQACCDPALLKIDAAKNVTESAKCNELMEMIPSMVEEGRKILLFSQFTSMLALIEKKLDLLKIPYVKLTGNTKDRETPIRSFQEGKVPLFLISLKAGGTGLNLTAADTVIHYDPWWNPAVENQATDRAYRIGQDKPVFVYKLITAGTVEEKILEMQEKKRQLMDALFDPAAKASSKLTASDIQALFEPLG